MKSPATLGRKIAGLDRYALRRRVVVRSPTEMSTILIISVQRKRKRESMRNLPYMPLYVAEFEADTAHLTFEEDGVYNRLLRLCWRTTGCSLPDDPAWIARRMRCDMSVYHKTVEPIVKEFFHRHEGRLHQKRQRKEWLKAKQLSDIRSAAGKKGGRPANPLKLVETD